MSYACYLADIFVSSADFGCRCRCGIWAICRQFIHHNRRDDKLGFDVLYRKMFLVRAVSDFTQNSKSKILKTLGEPGGKFSLILILRLMPLVPYNALNYACGVMNVSLREYVVATFVGIVPATFIMVNLGEKALDMRSNGFIFACILMVVLVVLSSWGAKKIRAKRGDLGNNSDL